MGWTKSARLAALPAALVLTFVLAETARAQSWRTITTSRQLSGEDRLTVDVTYGAGRLQVRPASEGVLYRMRLRYDEEAFEPRTGFDGRRLTIGVEGSRRSFDVRGDRDPGELALDLARAVPMDLRLEFGAVRADVDLGGLSLTRLRLATGASESVIRVSRPNPVRLDRAAFEVGAADFAARDLANLNAERIDVHAGVGDLTLDFGGEWRADSHVRVNLGLGSLQLRFPPELGVRLRKSGLLVSLDSEGLVKRDDSYYSPGWEEAARRVTVEVNGALGSVRVGWLD